MTDNIYWIWFSSLNKMGSIKKKALIDYFGHPEMVYKARREDIERSKILKPKECDALFAMKDLKKAEKAKKFIKEHHIVLISIQDEGYPKKLKTIYDPPVLLYALGDITLLQRDLTIAMVGSRKASMNALQEATKFGTSLSKMGITIVSGLAAGIDGASHEGAINYLGSTIAVIGTGINRCYPRSNSKIYQKIAQKGLILSEYFLDEPPLAFHFPQRNRIISGLSDGLLVVEAREKSGALITAKMALEQGRTVYVIPQNIETPSARGSNQLMKDGAKIVTEPKDILEEYVVPVENLKTSQKNPSDDRIELKKTGDLVQDKILAYVAEGYNTREQLLYVMQMSIAELNGVLSMMELQDLIVLKFDQIYLV